MSFGRLTLAFGLLAAGCQGEYPIAPTACDEWCHATKGFGCGFYDPAGCVSDCERQQFTRNNACRPVFDAALRCFQNTPGAADQHCSFDGLGTRPCEAELQALYECASEVPELPVGR
jgi:hypothetical protein